MSTPGASEAESWPLWEVFVRANRGLSHVHVGSLHAPDPDLALRNARDVYTRRNEGVSIWSFPRRPSRRAIRMRGLRSSRARRARTTATRATTRRPRG